MPGRQPDPRRHAPTPPEGIPPDVPPRIPPGREQADEDLDRDLADKDLGVEPPSDDE